MTRSTLSLLLSVLSLAGVALLFVQQGELASLVRAVRAPARPVEEAPELGNLEHRLAVLERGAAIRPAHEVTNADVAEPARTEAGSPPLASERPGGRSAPEGATDTSPEEFRRRVRAAIDADRRQQTGEEIQSLLDRLVVENRIGALSEDQRESVEAVLVETQERIPELFRKVFSERPGDVPREERRELMRAAFDELRTATVSQLEEIVPAADAKVVVEAAIRPGPGRGFRGR